MDLYVNRIVRRAKNLKSMLKTQRFNVNRIILFGSVVRGELTPHSDIDICIVLTDGDRRSDENRAEIMKIQEYVEGIVGGVCDVDYVVCNYETLSRRDKVFDNIWKEGVVAYGDVLEHS